MSVQGADLKFSQEKVSPITFLPIPPMGIFYHTDHYCNLQDEHLRWIMTAKVAEILHTVILKKL